MAVPQQRVMAEHRLAVADGVSGLAFFRDREAFPHLINALFPELRLRLRSWRPAGWLAVNSDIRCSIFLTSFPYSATTQARSSILPDSRISSRYSI